MRISDWSSDVCSSDLIDLHVEITTCRTGIAGFAFAAEADAITGLDARRHFHFQRLVATRLAGTATGLAGFPDQRASAAALWAGLLQHEETLLSAHLPGAVHGLAAWRLLSVGGAVAFNAFTFFPGWGADIFVRDVHTPLPC